MRKEPGFTHLTSAQVHELVPMADAVSALRSSFANSPHHYPRSHVPLGDKADVMFMMPAVASQSAGVKIVSIASGNSDLGLPLVNGIYILIDRSTGVPKATMDGAALTNIRTPAASAVATDLLADPDSATLGIFGTGVQARHHITAILAVRPDIGRILIAGRTIESGQKFIESVANVDTELVAATPAQAAGCDIVCGCTSAFEPVIPTAQIRDGAHINLVGSYSAERREINLDLILKATVYVDDRDAAASEAGELIHADQTDTWSFAEIAGDLVDIACGNVSRQSNNEITLFKSVGLSVEDLVIAELAAERAGVA